jgi:hypothetical protein
MKSSPAKSYYDDDLDTGPDTKDESPTALLPKSVLQGKEFKVGDTLTLTITALRNDEVQVSVTDTEDEPEEDVTETPTEEATEEMPEGEMMASAGTPPEGNFE